MFVLVVNIYLYFQGHHLRGKPLFDLKPFWFLKKCCDFERKSVKLGRILMILAVHVLPRNIENLSGLYPFFLVNLHKLAPSPNNTSKTPLYIAIRHHHMHIVSDYLCCCFVLYLIFPLHYTRFMHLSPINKLYTLTDECGKLE